MRFTKEVVEDIQKLTEAMLNLEGHEINNPVPLTVPAKFKRPVSLKEQIKRLLRVEISNQASSQGAETFEEANDFAVDDDEQVPISEYELMQDEFPVNRPLPPQEPLPAPPSNPAPEESALPVNEDPK